MKTSTPPPRTKPEILQRAIGNPPRLESAALFLASEEVLIAHAGDTYRLRRTRQGKLILTK